MCITDLNVFSLRNKEYGRVSVCKYDRKYHAQKLYDLAGTSIIIVESSQRSGREREHFEFFSGVHLSDQMTKRRARTVISNYVVSTVNYVKKSYGTVTGGNCSSHTVKMKL